MLNLKWSCEFNVVHSTLYTVQYIFNLSTQYTVKFTVYSTFNHSHLGPFCRSAEY